MERPSFQFVCTGFGPFCGVKENPTSDLVNELKNEGFDGRIIETCTEDANKSLEEMYKYAEQSAEQSNKIVIFLHFGVDYGATHIKLEQCAHNEATFRVPDERGHTPYCEPILTDRPYQETIHSMVDAKAICELLERPDLKLSTDPGRFVCNYTYYLSLARNTDRIRSLFVHVPPFKRIEKSEQMNVIKSIMAAIESIECGGASSA